MNNKKPTILFVEDEADLIDIYHTVFDQHGYRFLSTADIEEAFVLTLKEKPEIVLLDIILPKQTGTSVDISSKQGLEYLERVKKDPKTKDTPVIIFTNLNSVDCRQRARDLGAIDYIVKADILPQHLFKKVEKIVKVKEK